MRGTVAKRLRRKVGGQELPQFRKYVLRDGHIIAGTDRKGRYIRGDIIFLHPESARAAYQMEKKDYKEGKKYGY